MGGLIEIVVRQDSVDNALVVAVLTQPLSGDLRMDMQVGILFIVAIVKQPGHPPQLLILTVFAGIKAHRSLNRKHMLLQILIFCMGRYQFVCVFTCWHNSPQSVMFETGDYLPPGRVPCAFLDLKRVSRSLPYYNIVQ